jgi:hypothetical protein
LKCIAPSIIDVARSIGPLSLQELGTLVNAASNFDVVRSPGPSDPFNVFISPFLIRQFCQPYACCQPYDRILVYHLKKDIEIPDTYGNE